MTPYKNLLGDSSVSAFEIGSDYIKVQFTDGSLYLYDSGRPGSQAVEQMKQLALQGFGLNSYISTSIKKNYSSKLV